VSKLRKLGKKKVVIEVDYRDLDKLVTQVYGDKDYSFVAVELCGNDSTHSFAVDGQIFDEDSVKQIKQGNVPDYANGVLLNLLCKEGYIKKGIYNVGVCW
jgi:hypothetical protein